MIQVSQQTGLSLESMLEVIGIGKVLFQRNSAIEPLIYRLIDRPHAASSELLDDAIATLQN